jgi:hypothetical protein
LIVIAAACLALAIAPTATPDAGAAPLPGARFVFEQCDSALPGGAVPALEFKDPNGGAMGPVQSCAAPNGAIGVLETGGAPGDPSWLEVGVPETPGGFVEAETITAFSQNLGAGNALAHVYEDGFPAGGGAEWPDTFRVHSERSWFGGNGGAFSIVLPCDAPGTACNVGAGVYAHFIAATEVDPTPPTLSAISGTLLAGGTIRGHQTLSATAHDVGGGLSSLTALVNGLPATTPTPGACVDAVVSNRSVYGTVSPSPTPCPATLSGSWVLDTGAYPFHDGANSVSVCAADFATLGNPNTTCSPAQTIEVDNSCTESPVPGGEAISAQFARSEKETITVGFGKEAEVTGDLRDDAGDPIPGATICVKSQTLGVQPAAAPVGTATTDSQGHFVYKVAAGPNRELLIGYRHDSSQVARGVRYYAHAAPSLEVNPAKLRNGKGIHLWGALPPPSSGKRVVFLQANVVGAKRWITFRRATADGHGDFSAGYQFHSTTQKTAYRFRAVVPEQDHYPYVEGHSKPVRVVVRPAGRR